MKLVHSLTYLIVFLFHNPGWTCITTEELHPLNPEIQIKTYFWMSQLKRGIRIAQTTYNGEPFFIMIGCKGIETPSIETMDDWSSVQCKPLGNVWLPMLKPGEPKNPEISYFVQKFEESLDESVRELNQDSLFTKAIDLTDIFIKGTVGVSLIYFSQNYPKNPNGKHYHTHRYIGKFLKVGGWIWIGHAIWKASEWYNEKSFNREDKTKEELEEILLAIKNNRILHIDGQETDRRIDYLFSFDSILNSFEKAAIQTYEDICQKNP